MLYPLRLIELMFQVQRISDGFEGFQYSHVPGLYPTHIDASGCKYEDPNPQTPQQVVTSPEQTSQHQKRAAIDSQGNELPDRANMGNAMRESLTTESTIGQSAGFTD